LEKANTLKLSLMERDYNAQMNQLKEKQRNELHEAKLMITEEVIILLYCIKNNNKF